jgi:hypothetical protein
VSYGVENALFQWEEGERRLREADPGERARRLAEAERVLERLRQKLGSEFSVQELSDLYAREPDWSPVPSWVVDAAFARYARHASDFGGGRRQASIR